MELDKLSFNDSKRQSWEFFDARGENIEKDLIKEKSNDLGDHLFGKQDYLLVSGDGRYTTSLFMGILSDTVADIGISILYAGNNNVTPLSEYAMRKYGVSTVTVTASHQSGEFNGLKIGLAPDSLGNSENLETLVDFSMEIPIRPNIYDVQKELREEYISTVVERFKGRLRPGVLNILYDAMQGVSYPFFKEITDRLGLKISKPIREESNPSFNMDAENQGPDPLKKSNFVALKKYISDKELSQYDFIAIVDGDGDRFGLAIGDELVSSPVISAVRAKYLAKKFKENNPSVTAKPVFVAEYVLTAMIKEYLAEEVELIPVRRGRPAHLSKITELKEKDLPIIGGAEISLHHYNELAIDDGIETTLLFAEIVQTVRKEGLEKMIDDAKANLKPSHREQRIKTISGNDQVIDYLSRNHDADAKLQEFGDAIFKVNSTEFVFHASNNDPTEIAVTAFGNSLEKIKEDYQSVYQELNEFEHGLGNKLKSKIEEEK